jgi:hypothetical protein
MSCRFDEVSSLRSRERSLEVFIGKNLPTDFKAAEVFSVSNGPIRVPKRRALSSSQTRTQTASDSVPFLRNDLLKSFVERGETADAKAAVKVTSAP